MRHYEDTFYFDDQGNSKQILRYLDCYERVIYFYHKNKYLLDYDILNLFISNYLPRVDIQDNKIKNIITCPSNRASNYLADLSFVSSNLDDLLFLLKKGEYAVFQTSDADVPFCTVFKKYNLDESEYGDYYFTIDCVDDYLYIPLMKYRDYEHLYRYNNSIFYIHCNEMKQAFEKQLKVYRFVNNGKKERKLEAIQHELLSNILQDYNLSLKKDNVEIHYGISCIMTLLQYSQKELFLLTDLIQGKNLYLRLRYCILATIGKRQILKECLLISNMDYKELIPVLTATINNYIKFISLLEIEYMKNNLVFGNRYSKILEDIINSENNMKHTIYKNLQKRVKI